jgi:hypothetical protein
MISMANRGRQDRIPPPPVLVLVREDFDGPVLGIAFGAAELLPDLGSFSC